MIKHGDERPTMKAGTHSQKSSLKEASRDGLNAEPTEPTYRPRWKKRCELNVK